MEAPKERSNKYIPQHVLRGFDTYKYNSKDTSPFSNYIMHPFWNQFVKIFPLWVPANAITFIGFLLLPMSFFILAYYDYDFTHNYAIPRWVWLMCAINNFLSHTLDGVDGKQARRTKTSSVLGELFDHGLDAWSTTFFAIAIYDIYGRGEWGAPPLRFLLVLTALQCTFIFSHWEKYNTGILYLPWGYDIALTGMTACYLMSYFFSVEVWWFRISLFGHTITLCNFLEMFLYISNYVCSVPVCIYNVYMGYAKKTGRMLSFGECIRPLGPVAVLFPLIYIWAAYSKTGIVESHPRCFFMLSGVIFANITSRTIVAQMSKTRADAFNHLLVPLMVITPVAIMINLGVFEVWLLYAYTIIATLIHINYGVHVVHEIAEHLNIYVFSVNKPPARTQ